MLKIKDEVDLNILIQEYGFKPKYDEDTGELSELYRINGYYIGEYDKRRKTATITKEENLYGKNPWKNFWNIFAYNKAIVPTCHRINLDTEDYEILYDLIKANLVEKI